MNTSEILAALSVRWAAVEVAAPRAVTGTTVVTGLGFQPTAVLDFVSFDRDGFSLRCWVKRDG